MIVQIFQEVIDRDIQLEILPVLTQIVKSYLQIVREPFETQLNQLRNSIGQQNEQQQKVIKQQLLDIKKEIDKKSFSQEMIIREIYYLSQYSSQKRQYDQVMRQLSKQLIRNGQPLELIDGDTLQFISNIYENIYSENDKEEVLVVSVIGVQSAGKSLLLNFLFGTQFHSSAGRCTKGVYSSILTYQCPNSGRNKKILLLDTEGIQSPDARDPTFDRKIVYYILSISHVILLCNKQEMNKDMGEILKLVAYELVNAKQQNIQSPDIYIILNMLAQLDSKIQNECVNKLQDEFIEINENKEQESVNETLKITIDNVIPLPFAFQTINFGPNKNNDESKINTVNIPQLEFTNLIQKLRKRILSKFDDIESVKTQKMSLYQWFKFAEHTWEYTNQLRTLECFSNLLQKKQDKILTDLINRLVEKHYNDSWNLTLKKFVDDYLQETLDSLAGGGAIQFGNVQRQIQTRLDNKYEDVARQALIDYQRECKEMNIQTQLQESKQRVLEKKREHFIKKAHNYCAKKVLEFIQRKSQNVGDSTLQQIIVKLLKQQNSYSEKEAIEIFEKEAWPEVLKKSQDVLSTRQETIKRIQSNVSNEFLQVIKMRNEEKESFCNNQYYHNSNLFQLYSQIMQTFKNQQLIHFEGNRKPVNYKQVLEFQRQDKKFLNKFPKQIFQEDQVFEYYKWKKALIDSVNISKLSHDIRIAVLDEYENNFLKSADKIWNNIKNQFQILFGRKDLTYEKICRTFNNKNKVYDIIKIFKKELQKLGIEYIQDTSYFIPSEQYEYEQRTKYNVVNTQQIIYLNIERMLNSDFYFKPYGLPVENPNEPIQYYGYQSRPIYEYLVFKEYYCIDDYLQNSQMEIDQKDLFFNNKIRNVIVSKEMKTIVDAKYQASIDQFLKFLSGSKKLKNFDHLAQKQTILYFQNQLNWAQIINEIEDCIVKNNSRIKGQTEKLSFYIENLKKNDNQSVNILKQFHLFESSCTRGVITDVKKLIEDINGELNNFSLSVSEEGMSLIYLLAQTALIGFCYNLEFIEHNQPIRMLDNRKDIEKKLFVGRLTMNNSMVDQGLGFKLINDYSKHCYEDCKQFIVDQFKEEIDNISEEFQNINQIKQLEQFCIDIQQKRIDYGVYNPNHEEQKEINDYIQLIVDPKKILEKKFELKFLKVSENLILSSIRNFKLRFVDVLENFQSFLMQFQLEISKKKIDKITAGILFQLDDSSPLKLDDIPDIDLQKYQKEALMRYFLQMISQSWNSTIILKFQNDRICLTKNPNYNLPIFTDISIKFDEQNQNFIKQILKEDDQISNINVFIEEAIKTIKTIKSSLEINIDDGQIHENNPQDNDANKFILNKQELLGQCYQKLRQKYIGCKEHCPMCRKQCDAEHKEHEEFKDERHECKNGHQMQGFGGSKHFKVNFAILKSCDEIQDQDNIKFNGEDIIWQNFKLNKFPNWSFDSKNEAEVQKNREKNVKIWNLIGQDLCSIYNRLPQNIDIVFKEATNEPEVILNIQKIHYVIMLDDSGSMSGKPWQELMKAFTKFLNKLLDDKYLKDNSWITVINHNETSIPYFEEKQPNLKLIDDIKFRSGENDFDNPLFDAHRICKKNPNKYDKFLLYFMSDGVWSFPQSGINRLIQDSTIINKIEFHSIAFGSKANKDILSRMANSFPNGQGKMSDAPNAQALAQTFIDIVPNIYA